MNRKLYIVAGHGQGDPGAIGCGYQEADLTRKLAKDLFNRLKESGVDVVLYPVEKKLSKTQEYSFFEKGSYVFEIHFNSFSDIKANGTELLIQQGLNADEIDKSILNVVAKYFTNRGIKSRNDLVNMYNFSKRGIGYSLLEVCFIVNQSDMDKFNANYNNIVNDLIEVLGGKEQEKVKATTKYKVGETVTCSTRYKEITNDIINVEHLSPYKAGIIAHSQSGNNENWYILQFPDGQFWCNDGDIRNTVTNETVKNTVGQKKVFRIPTKIYQNSNLTGTKYDYKANTTVTIQKNIDANVDEVKVNLTGRRGYVSNKVYK